MTSIRAEKIINNMTDIKPVSSFLFGGLILFFVFEYLRIGNYLPALETAKINTVIPVLVFILTIFSIGGPNSSSILKAKNTRWIILFLFLFFTQAFTADVTFYVFNAFKAVFGYMLIFTALGKFMEAVDFSPVKSDSPC